MLFVLLKVTKQLASKFYDGVWISLDVFCNFHVFLSYGPLTIQMAPIFKMVVFMNKIWILGITTNMKFVELHKEHCFKATIQMEGVEFHAFELFPIDTYPYHVWMEQDYSFRTLSLILALALTCTLPFSKHELYAPHFLPSSKLPK